MRRGIQSWVAAGGLLAWVTLGLGACGDGPGGDHQVGGETSDFVHVRCGKDWRVPELRPLAKRFGLDALRDLAAHPFEQDGVWLKADGEPVAADAAGAPADVRPAVHVEMRTGEPIIWGTELCGFVVRVPVDLDIEVGRGQLSARTTGQYVTSDMDESPFLGASAWLPGPPPGLDLGIDESRPHAVFVEVTAMFDADPPRWDVFVGVDYLDTPAAKFADGGEILTDESGFDLSLRFPKGAHADLPDPTDRWLGATRADIGCSPASEPLAALGGRTGKAVLSQAWAEFVPDEPVPARWHDGSETRLTLQAPTEQPQFVCLRRAWGGLRLGGLGPAHARSEDGRVDLALDTFLWLAGDGSETREIELVRTDSELSQEDPLARFAQGATGASPATDLDARLQFGRSGRLIRIAAFSRWEGPTYACLGAEGQEADGTSDIVCRAPQ